MSDGKKMKFNVWMIASVILVIVLVGVIIFYSTQKTSSDEYTPTEAADRAMVWISDYFDAMESGITASLINVTESDSGVYEFAIKLSSTQGDEEQIYYVSRDGSLFFPEAIETEELVSTQIAEQDQTSQTTAETVKADRPEAHAFIMSYCPYGQQFLSAYMPVIEALGNVADLQVNFVNYAMHGEQELTENSRMYCIQDQQSDKFVDYINCFLAESDAESCMAEVGVDVAKVDACMDLLDRTFNITGMYNDESTWLSGRYPLYLVDDILIKQYGLEADGSFGSPTFVLNGQEISVARTPEAIKQVICDSFTTPPEECSEQLSTEGASATGGCET